MLPNIKKLLAMLLIPCLMNSCTFSQGNDKKRNLPDSISIPYNIYVSELNQEQQFAFDALNKLQTSTDEMNRLYSTFANIEQPCYPADTSFVLSQSELLFAMQQFTAKHCKNLNPEIQNQLTKASVLAQKKYTILHCTENKADVNYRKELPMTGIWVIPNVLGRRDVILEW